MPFYQSKARSYFIITGEGTVTACVWQTYVSAPAKQRVHHEVPVSQFHLEQFEHVAGNQVFQLQVHHQRNRIKSTDRSINQKFSFDARMSLYNDARLITALAHPVNTYQLSKIAWVFRGPSMAVDFP